MVAPCVHADVVRYYRLESADSRIKMMTLTIDRTIKLFESSDSVLKLNDNFDDIFGWFMTLSKEEVADKINLS